MINETRLRTVLWAMYIACAIAASLRPSATCCRVSKFLVGQFRKGSLRSRTERVRLGDLLGDRFVQDDEVEHDRSDRGLDLVRLDALHQIAAGAVLQGGVGGLVIVGHRRA